MKESTVALGTARSLVGILCEPPSTGCAAERPAVIILNAGVLHRVGPNRLYVHIARHLALLGLPSLRFDFSGIGDSARRIDELPYEQSVVDETDSVIGNLCATLRISRFILLGLCSGADIAFHVARRDARVVGVVLLNPQYYRVEADPPLKGHVRSKESARYVRHQAMWRAASWRKALTGKIDYRSVAAIACSEIAKRWVGMKHDVPGASLLKDGMQEMWSRGLAVLAVFSFGEPGLDYLRLALGSHLKSYVTARMLHVEVLHNADHLFTQLESQRALLQLLSARVPAMLSNRFSDVIVQPAVTAM